MVKIMGNEQPKGLVIASDVAVLVPRMVCMCGAQYYVRLEMLEESLASAKRRGWVELEDGAWECFDCVKGS
jgi:hypothetical protein